jgi:hypothetical protein
MPDRTDERTRERERSGADLEDLGDDFTDFGDLDGGSDGLGDLERSRSVEESAGSGRLSGVRSRLGRLFSPRGFLLRTGVLAAGVFAAGFVPLLPGLLAAFLGVLIGGFAIGLFEGEQSYLETATAGLLVGGVMAFLGNLTLTLIGVGTPLVALGAVGGVVGAVLGLYFGRDLRAGLSKEL